MEGAVPHVCPRAAISTQRAVHRGNPWSVWRTSCVATDMEPLDTREAQLSTKSCNTDARFTLGTAQRRFAWCLGIAAVLTGCGESDPSAAVAIRATPPLAEGPMFQTS